MAECRVVLPKRWAVAFEHLGLAPGQDDCAVTAFVNREGHMVASPAVRNLPGYREVGVKLDALSAPA